MLPTFLQILGVGSQQVEDVKMLANMNENLQLREQCLELVTVTDICKWPRHELFIPDLSFSKYEIEAMNLFEINIDRNQLHTWV